MSHSEEPSDGDDEDDYSEEPKGKKASTNKKGEKKTVEKKSGSAKKKKNDPTPAVNTKGKALTPKGKATSKKPPKVQLNEKDAYNKVKDYMFDKNRPFSQINISDNLHGTIAKKTLEKVLD